MIAATEPVIIDGKGGTTLISGASTSVSIRGGDSEITGLTFSGVSLSLSQNGGVQVSDNQFDRGIRIDGISNVTISNNRIGGSSGYGIEIVNSYGEIGDLVGIVIDNNLITNCPLAGIRDGERNQNQGSHHAARCAAG